MCCLDIYVRPGLEGKVNKRRGRAGKNGERVDIRLIESRCQ